MANKFKKFKLMSEDELDRLRQRQILDYNPEARTLAAIQSGINAVLERNGAGSVEQKLALLTTLQNRFQQLKSKVMPTEMIDIPAIERGPIADEPEELHPVAEPEARAEPRVVALAQPAVPAQAAAAYAEPDEPPGAREQREHTQTYLQAFLNELPPDRRSNARTLFDLIGAHPDVIDTDYKHQLRIRGQTVPRSNIFDLVHRLYALHPIAQKPHGFKEFAAALRELNVPRGIIANPELLDLPKSSPMHTRSSTVLHVYP